MGDLLADRAEVHDLLMRYCRGVDRADGDLLRSLFHGDATVDFGRGEMPAANLIAGIETNGAAKGAMHFAGNELVEFDGDTAASELYFISYATIDREGTPFTRSRGGRYLDRITRRDGQWRIEHRTLVDEWSRIDPVAESI